MYPQTQTVRVDLHCHTSASNEPSLWLMKQIGCPESFVPPQQVRETALHRGMDFVAVTDHNTIEGAKEIRHHPDVIVGNEATVSFPDGCKIHVVCLGLSDAQFEHIELVRHNIFEFVEYVNRENIAHFCAHPLYTVNGRLKWEHFEMLALLFKHFEILNGSRFRRLNHAVEMALSSLTPEHIEEFSKRHGIAPVGERPWEKHFTGGSDDHSGLFVGSYFSEIEVEDVSLGGVLDAIRRGRTRPRGENDGCLTLAHQINSIAYQYYNSKFGETQQELGTVLGRIFERKPSNFESSKKRFRKGLKKLANYFRKPKGSGIDLYDEIKAVVKNNKALKSLFKEGILTREEFNQNVFQLSSDVLDEMILQVFKKPKFIPYFLLVAPSLLASYVMTTKNLHDDKDMIDNAERFAGLERPPRVAWFTDSIVNMDGVSKTCKMFLEAAGRRERNLTMVTCVPEQPGLDNLVNFQPIYTFPVPGYENVCLHLPSILKVLKFVEDGEFDSIIVSTPGPVGLLGMVLGKLMRIPVQGIYHTDLPRIAMRVSGDPMFGELALTLTKLFYGHVDKVFSPSKWYKDDISFFGIPEERIHILERWVDCAHFAPERGKADYWNRAESVKLLYVGRVSTDKNLDLLMRAHRRLSEKHPDYVLHVVGDGPFFEEMKAKTRNWPRFVMTGAKFGDDLADAYASSDLFVYPGLLDTFGNVVIEAQASGLPCVVMNEGGPQQLIRHGETGVVARSESEFIGAIDNLISDAAERERMGRAAAAYAKTRFAEERIFNLFWNEATRKPEPGVDPNRFRFENAAQPAEALSLTV